MFGRRLRLAVPSYCLLTLLLVTNRKGFSEVDLLRADAI